MAFLTQPYLLSLFPSTQMNVVWIQKDKTDAFVEFGTDYKLGNIIKAECYEITGLRAPLPDGTYGKIPDEHKKVSVWQYIAKIENLLPGQRIFYRSFNKNETTKVYDFHTAPEKGENYTFAQLSDLQGLDNCSDTVHKIGSMHPDFLLYSGDATYVSWRLDQWFNTGEDWQSEETKKTAFFPCMQQENGARLMQYAPMFFCPGNHELDDIRVYMDKEIAKCDENWNWSIFMQMFRPFYSLDDTTLTGKRWYSADYADMHIVSLSISRIAFWEPQVPPGFRLTDSIAPGSPQIKWLKSDLKDNKNTFKWIIQHFHILNKGKDVQFNLCDPVENENGEMTYPYDHGSFLMDLYSEYGVNAVTFGHSHVYERYWRKSTHYIEAAYLSICFRRGGELPHPSGAVPVVEDNSNRSFLIVERNSDGLVAKGYYAKDIPALFDKYRIADSNGVSVAP